VFRENGKWVVVDFKTDQELTGALERYRRQVTIYATAISKATASSCDSLLFRTTAPSIRTNPENPTDFCVSRDAGSIRG